MHTWYALKIYIFLASSHSCLNYDYLFSSVNHSCIVIHLEFSVYFLLPASRIRCCKSDIAAFVLIGNLEKTPVMKSKFSNPAKPEKKIEINLYRRHIFKHFHCVWKLPIVLYTLFSLSLDMFNRAIVVLDHFNHFFEIDLYRQKNNLIISVRKLYLNSDKSESFL